MVIHAADLRVMSSDTVGELLGATAAHTQEPQTVSWSTDGPAIQQVGL